MRLVRHIKKTRTYHHILMCEYVHHLENHNDQESNIRIKNEALIFEHKAYGCAGLEQTH